MKTMEQETKQSKSPENTGEIQVKRDKKGRFIKGESGNLKGKPIGAKSFSTLMDDLVEKIAKENNLSSLEVWQVLIKRGYSEAKNGNYLFYRDILDRYYGKPVETFRSDKDHPFIIQIGKEIAEKNELTSQPSDNSERPASV